MRRGEDASSPFLPLHVLESSSFALKKQTGACYAGVVLIFRFWRAGLSVADYCFGHL